MNCKKYTTQYFLPPVRCMDWADKDKIGHAPVWCSVDLRDGNQSLVEPMDAVTKTEFFKLLSDIGFKEIEVGFPAASETEYAFLRTLIEDGLIPDDVTVQVLTQAREHIIKKTFKALEGVKRAVVHVYNSTSLAQREQVFKKNRQEIKKIAVGGAEMLKELAGGNPAYRFEYSPESFTGTEPEYALEVINAVLGVWKPDGRSKPIINLPATVENASPHVYAQQVEYIRKNMDFSKDVVLSVHPHNDRGCGVAAAELALLAGADRVEGTLFGNGERTGNADLITLAMNMFSQGVDPGLDFSDMPRISGLYKRFTGMPVSPRQPYAGELVFAAFSGSHQDAIAKGMELRSEGDKWTVPYLPIDPRDVGREYDSDVIRINSQSGKGGVGYVLKTAYGIDLPPKMKEAFGYSAKRLSDSLHKELRAEELYGLFMDEFVLPRKAFGVTECHFRQIGGIEATVTFCAGPDVRVVKAVGNGRLDAFSNAVKQYVGADYTLTCYEQHAMTGSSSAKAVSFVAVEREGNLFWGAGIDDDIIKSSYNALVSAVNNMLVG